MSALVLLGIVLAAILLMKLTCFQFDNKYIDLIRPLFPSWSFFGDPESIYLPEYQVLIQGNEGRWRPVFPKRSRRWTSLVHNPEINFLHAVDTLVHHLVTEIYGDNEKVENHDFERYSNYALLNRAIYQEIVKNEVNIDPSGQYRFRIRQGCIKGDVFQWEDFFYSKTYNLSQTRL